MAPIRRLAAQTDVDKSERFNQTMITQLKTERDAVVDCCVKLAPMKETGHRIEAVSECVQRRICGDPGARPGPCTLRRGSLWAAVRGGHRDAATPEEARAAAAAKAAAGLDAAVLRDPHVIRHNKRLYDEGHHETVAVVRALLKAADIEMLEPLELIPDKPFTPANGDKRTYVSLATYCWPSNPDDLQNPKGPWECKDGLPFPGRHVIAPDFEKLLHNQLRAVLFGMAWHFSREERYAARAAEVLRTFYLDPDTGMLPTLLYAQLRAGSPEGAATGTIDNHGTQMVFDGVALLEGSAAWTAEDGAALHRWFSEYVQHLQSPHCRPEAMQENNHGTYFDVQYLSILLFLRREDDAKEFITNVVKPRLRSQIVGSVMPTEMTRPKSYSYHSFILEGYVQLAMMAEKVGVNLWDVGADTGNSMLDAWDWMVQHWCDRSERIWPVQQIEHPKLDLNRPQEWAGAAYAHAARRAKGRDAYTLRSRHYALLYHSFRGGPDPKEEMDWARALVRQLGFVKFDDCFVATCPDRSVLPVDPPSYPASCIPTGNDTIGDLNALVGVLRRANTTRDILPALRAGDSYVRGRDTAAVIAAQDAAAAEAAAARESTSAAAGNIPAGTLDLSMPSAAEGTSRVAASGAEVVASAGGAAGGVAVAAAGIPLPPTWLSAVILLLVLLLSRAVGRDRRR